MTETPFQAYVRKVVERYGTAGAVAEALGISLSAFSREVRTRSTLGAETCIRLALEVGDDPGAVLKLAGKGDAAALYVRAFGSARTGSAALPSGPVREVAELWAEINERDRAIGEAHRTLLREHHRALVHPRRR